VRPAGRINSNLQLARVEGVLYQLSGRVDVGTDTGGAGTAGTAATLTIDPGVTVFAASGVDFLVVNRGSRLVAEGTAARPIVFTARQNITGSATDTSDGLWGGIVMLGRAPISNCNSAVAGGTVDCQAQIEGTTNALYGGATANDNSGSLRYVQIRYSGVVIGAGNELQGLTTGGVGSATQYDYVQVHNSSDDGVEFFGGRHNFRHLIVTGASDDSVDTDVGYKGNIQFLIVAQRPGAGDRLMEVDSSGGENTLPRQNIKIANATFLHNSTVGGNSFLIHGGADYALYNSVVVARSGVECFDIDGAGTMQATGDDEAGPPAFNSVVASCGSTPIDDDGDISAAAIQSLFTTGTNNNLNFTSSLTGGFVNGPNETAVTPFNATGVSSFFTAVTYIGAVQNASDVWYRGWTCDSGTAAFGSNSNCTGLPSFA
jgi:hypothetical protein